MFYTTSLCFTFPKSPEERSFSKIRLVLEISTQLLNMETTIVVSSLKAESILTGVLNFKGSADRSNYLL